jgi:PAS domain S-box-containing protein
MSLNKTSSKMNELVARGFEVKTEPYFLELNRKIKKKLKTNNFYKAISSTGEDVVKVLSSDGIFQFVSPSVEAITGFSEEELLGRNILSFIDPSSKKAYQDLLVFKKHWEHRKLKLKIPHKKGHMLYFESYCYFQLTIDDADLFVLLCKNVTPKVIKSKLLAKSRANEALALSLFKKLNEVTGNIVSLWDVKKQIPIYYNNPNPLGYNYTTDLETLTSLEIVHPEDFDKVKSYKTRITTVPYFNPPLIEFRIKTKDGAWEWLLNISIVTKRDENGLPVLLLSYTNIVTELKKVQKQLLESNSRNTILLTNTNESIWSMNRNYAITSFNQRFVDYFFVYSGNYPELGDSVFKFSTPEEEILWKRYYDRAFQGEKFSDVMVYNVGDKKFYFDCSFVPMREEGGVVEEICCFVRDITNLKKSEIELEQLNFELDSFVYRASHDMSAPLKSIQGLVYILQMDLTEEEKAKYFNLIHKSILKLQTFIEDLTYFSRNSKTPITPEPIDFHHIIKECRENLAYMENAARLKIDVRVANDLHFVSDKSRIQIILQNFISNAIKYQQLNAIESYLKIDITHHQNGVIIDIRDNGTGIREEYLNNIFDMFFRASEESHGSGLGLYITKQAIEKLGGKILKLESTFGKGTSFSIYLPSSK